MKKFLFIIACLIAPTNFTMQQRSSSSGTQSLPTSPTTQRIMEPQRPQTPPLNRSGIIPAVETILDEIRSVTFGQPSKSSSSSSGIGYETSGSEKETDETIQYHSSLNWCGDWLTNNPEPIIISVIDKDGNKLVADQEITKGQQITWSINYKGRVLLEIKQKSAGIFEKSKKFRLFPDNYCAILMGKDIVFKVNCKTC